MVGGTETGSQTTETLIRWLEHSRGTRLIARRHE
jgi:hypothetical protein